ncbi:MAG: hypothetical protein GWM98_13015, partial [Nitrospinaceae bacterium]|nr:hypothetical protein [Nitrospinaceae bacterium]NIR55488.1 hypothetical protein [Nitrospinaceae bacterium]NIS85658.1 hypothetical protein [Nitrospinaceae bacterium]NIT82503.1 hypothetical protein [Nitrospinaceae bacterium]NIU44708.1 hypothetical protein [Nitrospinaceae bacterium]
RYGDGRGEIVDFLLVSNGECYPPSVPSNAWIEIYLKARFLEEVSQPIYGMEIRTIDGIKVLGTNTRFKNIICSSVKKEEIRVYRFRVKMSLNWGEYFVGLGMGDILNDTEDIPLDRRHGLIHLVVQESNRFDGLVNLDCSIEEF